MEWSADWQLSLSFSADSWRKRTIRSFSSIYNSMITDLN